jgi:hypothetical protein
MYIEKTIEIDVDLDDFEYSELCEYVLAGANKEENKFWIDRLKEDLDFHSIDWVIGSVHSMDRDKFEELYEIIINDYKYITMEKK